MIPNIINESNINRFCYWDERVCQGMMYEGELYRYVSSCQEQERVDLFLLGMKLTQQGMDICITHLDHTYSLWLSLRLPSLNIDKKYSFADSPVVSQRLKVHDYVTI